MGYLWSLKSRIRQTHLLLHIQTIEWKSEKGAVNNGWWKVSSKTKEDETKQPQEICDKQPAAGRGGFAGGGQSLLVPLAARQP